MAPTDRQLLQDYLADREAACPVCRYNLRGLDGDHCPECGARIDLRVGSIDLRLGPWLACVLSIALPMGFTGILALLATIGAQQSVAWRSGDWVILGLCWFLTVAYAVGLWLLSKRRGRFLRLPAAQQWRRAGLLAAVMVVLLVGTVWLIARFL